MPSFQPLVSIVIPVYNGADYVGEAIESALLQTYTKVEILVVNDGSKDEGATAAIARSYGDRIRYFEKPNGGVATALNYGIERMNGEYFSWLSHDDLYLPSKLSRQVDLLETLVDREVVLYSDYQLIDERSRVTSVVRLDHEMLAAKPLYSVLRGSIHGCSTLVPRSAFEKFGVFNPELATTQDYALWFDLARQLPFLHIPEPLICSRWHPAQGSKTHPATLREANELWMGFAERLTEAEMLRCEPTIYRFYHQLAHFLSSTPYLEAQQEIQTRAEAERQRVLATITDRKVSVVIPVRDRIALAVESVQSAASQTHRSLEILVINNASTENLGPLRELEQSDERIRLLDCPSGGASAARNLGIGSASGEFIAFLDADDLWYPDKVSRQLEAMLLQGELVCYTDYATFTEPDRLTPVNCAHPAPLYPALVKGCLIATPTMMIKRSLLADEPRFRFQEALTLGEDVCLWLDLARVTNFLHLSSPLTKVRAHPESAANDRKKQTQGLLNIISHVTRNADPFETPLELCSLLQRAYWELEAVGVNRILETASSSANRWPRAPLTNRLLERYAALHRTCPPLLRSGTFPVTKRIMRALDWQARLERHLRLLYNQFARRRDSAKP